jgi:type I restriction enzyme S subunit
MEICIPEYVYYNLRTKYYIGFINGVARGTSTQPNMKINALLSYKILIPSVEEQQRITSILSSLDDKIELNLQMNKTLEATAQAIFKEWFVDFRLPGFDGEFVDGLPKEWRKGKLGEIIKNFDSKRVPVSSQERAKRKGIYPYYGAASLMDYIDNYLFDGTYLLMGEDGSVIDDNGYPVLQYVWGKFWVNNHAHVIQGANSFSTEYIYILLQRTQISNIVTGAVQPKINQGNLNGIECIIPDDVRLQEFNKLVLPLFDRIKNNHDENIVLNAVRDSILPKLMTGKIRVA